MGSLSMKKMLRHSGLALVGGAILALQGCGVIYKTTGAVSYTHLTLPTICSV